VPWKSGQHPKRRLLNQSASHITPAASPAGLALRTSSATIQKSLILRRKVASEAANAFKHVKTTSKRGLEAAQVYERPPALAGRMMAGVSVVGDSTGAVVVDGHNLLQVVTEALRFLRGKTRADGSI
jgi:hypothetical protein